MFCGWAHPNWKGWDAEGWRHARSGGGYEGWGGRRWRPHILRCFSFSRPKFLVFFFNSVGRVLVDFLALVEFLKRWGSKWTFGVLWAILFRAPGLVAPVGFHKMGQRAPKCVLRRLGLQKRPKNPSNSTRRPSQQGETRMEFWAGEGKTSTKFCEVQRRAVGPRGRGWAGGGERRSREEQKSNS